MLDANSELYQFAPESCCFMNDMRWNFEKVLVLKTLLRRWKS